jgi:hypothetical protein
MSKPTTRILLAVLTCMVVGLVPSLAHVAPAKGTPQPWVLLPWDQDVGRIIGHEGSSEGPKSFALTPDGGVLLLDQVNARVLILDPKGKVTGTIALPSTTFDDVELFDGRAVLLLDRLVAKVLRVVDRQGTLLTEVALEGRGIERSGLITGMFPRADGVWLEVGHRQSVKILDRDLTACDRQVVLGRPIVNGRALRAELDGRGGVSVSVGRRNERGAAATTVLTGQAPIRRVVWIDADAKGRIHAVLDEVERSATKPFAVQSERYLLVTLDEHLRELERLESPWALTEYDQEVEFRIGPDGRLWQMAFTPEGVVLVDWSRRTP